ncbi:MAG: hypothetical protein AUH84_04010 [Thaumarchaeota archaeon 13_1_40CM_4_38_7]|nr:MAG: hypothetical protein AUH84_04010 [Thaumarchaeota archaeon 13_1_40CM_4_38_7]OLC94502.1 MAG: hypothetical protein AUI92_00490 [Thaumarchaeota archaeon 13_1_40CM_3_38_6]
MVEIWAFVAVTIPAMLVLGLRHALDVDHITAIDNLVRLHNAKKRSRWVGTGFGVGHMTSVLLEMVFIIVIAGSLTSTGQLAFLGGVVGIISLGTIGGLNIYTMKKHGKTGSAILANQVLHRIGLFGPFRSSLITGIIFGLGFDTATQISAITMSAVASATLGVQTALVLAGFFAIGMISIDTLDSMALRSAFSRIFQKNLFRNMSYALSGLAMTVAAISSYEILNNTDILPEWTGPSLAGGIIAVSFVYSFVTHT